MTTGTPTTTETTATAEAAFTVAAEMIAVERIHASANLRRGKLPAQAEACRSHRFEWWALPP